MPKTAAKIGNKVRNALDIRGWLESFESALDDDGQESGSKSRLPNGAYIDWDRSVLVTPVRHNLVDLGSDAVDSHDHLVAVRDDIYPSFGPNESVDKDFDLSGHDELPTLEGLKNPNSAVHPKHGGPGWNERTLSPKEGTRNIVKRTSKDFGLMKDGNNSRGRKPIGPRGKQLRDGAISHKPPGNEGSDPPQDNTGKKEFRVLELGSNRRHILTTNKRLCEEDRGMWLKFDSNGQFMGKMIQR